MSASDTTAPVLQVIVGSTRPGRLGRPIGEWFQQRAVEHGGFRVELVDLAEVDLPMMNEPQHPLLQQYVHQHTRDWSATIDRADAFVFVTPEYNFGFNAALKNALDYLHSEWAHKPAGFVSYGGVSAGTRAVQMLKQIVTTLRMVPLTDAVSIPFIKQFFDENGELHANEEMETAAKTVLDELTKLTTALRSLRTERDTDG